MAACVCSACGNEHTREERETYFTRNITHNLAPMAQDAGLYLPLWRPEEMGITEASQLIAPLEDGLAALEADPAHFKKLNPENGWGDYGGLVDFARAYLDACRANPEARVEASR